MENQDSNITNFGDTLIINSLIDNGIDFCSLNNNQQINEIKKFLNSLINKDDENVLLVNVNKDKELFDAYETIFYQSEETSFLKCKNCVLIFKLNSNNYESLKHHSLNCKDIDYQIDSKLIINKNHKYDLANECAFYSATSCRSFRTFQTAEFKRLAQQLISIGNTYGNIDASKVLPVNTTVSNHITIVAKSIRESVKVLITNLKSYVIIFDHWSPKYTRQKFLGIKLYFYDNQTKKFKSRLLVNKPVKDGTSELTLNYYDETIELFEINEEKIVAVVTDNAPGNEKTVRNKGYDWVGCTAHQLNFIIKHVFDGDKYVKKIGSYIDLNEACRDLVSFFNKSKKFELDQSLKQEFMIRWDTKYLMCASIFLNREKLLEIKDSKVRNLVQKINFEHLAELNSILKLFYESRLKLSSEKEPTINLVLPIKRLLLNNLEVKESDSHQFKAIKKIFKTEIENNLTTSLLHKVATFLTPKFRKMINLIDANELEKRVIKWIKDEIERRKLDGKIRKSGESVEDFGEFAEANETVEDEVKYYLNLELSTIDFKQPYEFWIRNESKMVYLSEIALEILSIPATSCPIERTFSQATLTLSNLRTNLSGDKIDECVFINSNRDLY